MRPATTTNRQAAEAAIRLAPGLALTVIAVSFALSFVGRGVAAQIWDDALFFRRVAYNILHHGFAGWNQLDGPVFMNTSQVYQLVTTLLLPLAPHHFNAVVVFWSALCLCACFWVLRTVVRAGDGGGDGGGDAESDSDRASLLLVLMMAPPFFMAITSGMETCTVFLVLALFLRVLLAEHQPPRVLPLALLNLLVYLTRPDAVLMTMVASVGMLPWDRRLLRFLAAAAAGLVLVSLAFYAYYGTAVPLSTFLKIAQISVYDQAYLAMGDQAKARNLTQLALTILPLLALLALRRDRTNLSLLAGALVFIAFHAITTNEIMGYHARFYAPALPLLMVATLRALPRAGSRLGPLLLAGAGLLATGLSLLAFERGWIENGSGTFDADRVPLWQYLVYALGLVVFGLLALVPPAARRLALPALTTLLALASVVRTTAQPLEIRADDMIYEHAVPGDRSLRGLSMIRRCFPEPLALTHSELGLPGVLLPESRIIDFTGLANPQVVRRQFDFERLCQDDRPEFIFRPHWTHQGLNQQLTRSPCLAARYTRPALPDGPFVRNDLLERFNTCAEGG
jgi:hypothetical protein